MLNKYANFYSQEILEIFKIYYLLNALTNKCYTLQ